MTTTEALVDHPAKFSGPILVEMVRLLSLYSSEIPDETECLRVLDPFAGVGGVHSLMDELTWVETTGVEIEPEWAATHPRTIQGDALALPFETGSFDALVVSPCYGNRMADQHEPRDKCRTCVGAGETDGERCDACRGRGVTLRHTYRHTLGRPLTSGSGAGLQWGPGYRSFHHAAWTEARRVLRPDALVLINVSNHIRAGEEQLVVEWHLAEWLTAGARLVDVARVETRRQKMGANRDLRVDCEFVLVFRTPRDRTLF